VQSGGLDHQPTIWQVRDTQHPLQGVFIALGLCERRNRGTHLGRMALENTRLDDQNPGSVCTPNPLAGRASRRSAGCHRDGGPSPRTPVDDRAAVGAVRTVWPLALGPVGIVLLFTDDAGAMNTTTRRMSIERLR
jgi:hypothetical protein